MFQYCYTSFLNSEDLGTETYELGYLKHYLQENKALDTTIQTALPILKFGNETSQLRILGSKKLIDDFDQLSGDKYDILNVPLENVQLVSIDKDKNLVLSIPDIEMKDVVTAKSIYDTYSVFLDEYKLTRFADYCLCNDCEDILNQNILELLKRTKGKNKQFRLLRLDDDLWAIRDITSEKYKNYDNNIVIYLSLLSIHKFASVNDRTYKVVKSYISDSFINFVIEDTKSITIPDVGDVYLSLVITNGEIRNYKFTVELGYRIVDKASKTISAIFDKSLVSILHSAKLNTVLEQIGKLENLDKYEETILGFITNLNKIKDLNEDNVYFMFKDLLDRIISCSDISSKTKSEFKKDETKQIFDNAMSLVQFFEKVQTIQTDMDEKIFIERILHTVIQDLLREKKN